MKKVESNDEPAPRDVELADPIRTAEIAESIESALTGYDIVRGDPVNVVQGKFLIPFVVCVPMF